MRFAAVSIRLGLVLSAWVWALAGCAGQKKATAAEKLYFALEVRQNGKLVGKPQLLGEEGKTLRAERRAPGADAPDYQLVLSPRATEGDAYSVELEVMVPNAQGQFDLALLHGQERRAHSASAADLEVTLLLMKVDSPEFRALMNLDEPAPLHSI